MAVASEIKEATIKTEPLMESSIAPPSPSQLLSKPPSDAASETPPPPPPPTATSTATATTTTTALVVSGTVDQSADQNDHSDSSSSAALQSRKDESDSSGSSSQRKDVDILLSPAYLKSEEYRLLFRLPPDEVLVQDFNCAFQESILLQGHMYLFIRHICFYSNIFGFETKKTIPFREVTCVRKAKTAAIFPNAIEIVSGGKKNFFASFLSRDEAYRLIVDGWSQSINGANVLIDRQDLKSEIRSQDDGHVIIEEVRNIQQATNDLYAADRNKDANPSEECKILSNGEDDLSTSTRLLEPQENGEEDTAIVTAECSSSGEPLRWKVEYANPPKVPDYFTKVAESKFPIQIEEFYNLFFSDNARSFTESFHTRCGDKDFRCTTWCEDKQFGHARTVSFQHPIKIYFGAKFGHCHEVQKFRVYRNSHLVIETSQEVSDVPYGDYFRVEGLWVAERDSTKNCCSLRVHVNVAFSKRTMWKGKIEQSTVEECREAYAIWINNAHEYLKQKNLEKSNETGPALKLIQSDVQLEGREDDEGPSQSLHNARNLAQIPSQGANSLPQNPVQADSITASFTTSLVGESLMRFRLYIRNRIHVPLVLVVACILILLLMQVSIIVLLTRAPQVHVVSQVDYMNGIMGSSKGDTAEAVAWLEKQVHHLKAEMDMVEFRLEKMRQEHALLKGQLKSLEHFKG